jgi:hypothetical protein
MFVLQIVIHSNKQNSNQVAKFKRQILEKMKTDPILFAALAKILDIKLVSLPVTIERNGNTLNQYSVVKLVSDHLQVSPEELLEEESEVKEPQETK